MFPTCAVVSVCPNPSRTVIPQSLRTCSITSGFNGSPAATHSRSAETEAAPRSACSSIRHTVGGAQNVVTWQSPSARNNPVAENRAWFSNYGDWVNVYALGEGLVNAFATGVYTYQEPPKRPARQVFDGMARWDGTSFSAPLVAGLIAAEMARSDATAADAAGAVLATAREINGVGRVLLPAGSGAVSGS